jgi:hypothetical protein
MKAVYLLQKEHSDFVANFGSPTFTLVLGQYRIAYFGRNSLLRALAFSGEFFCHIFKHFRQSDGLFGGGGVG